MKRTNQLVATAVIAGTLLLSGCSFGKQEQAQQATSVAVKVVPALQQDTPLTSEYAGQIRGLDEVRIQPRVSGAIVEKYFNGGQFVTEGQPLYKIDQRQYESAVLSARATLAQSQATLNNAEIDLRRDEALLKADAISEQMVTTQRAQVHSMQAMVDANTALLKKAQENLDDTIVYAPMSGRVDLNDVAIGTFAAAGQTNLVTIGTVNPVFVQFSVSETEYLKMFNNPNTNISQNNPPTVSITLSNGMAYPLEGVIAQADRALSENTGTLQIKAQFDNPSGILIPGMFARVKLGGEMIKNAILVPERGIQQVLDKNFVIVVGAEDKSETRTVELGEKVGNYYIVTKGINPGDKIVVEGLTKLQNGMDLRVTEVKPKDMGFTLGADAVPQSNVPQEAQQQSVNAKLGR